MITVSATIDNHGGEIAQIRIEKVEDYPDGTADYVVEFGVNNGQLTESFYRRRVEHFPRTKYNILGLLAISLQTLTPEELSLEPGTEASDLARRQLGAWITLPT